MDTGEVLLGSIFHPVQQQGNHGVVYCKHRKVMARRNTRDEAMNLFPAANALEENNLEYFGEYDEALATLAEGSFAARTMRLRRQREEMLLKEQRDYTVSIERVVAARRAEAERQEEHDKGEFADRLSACMATVGCFDKGGDRWSDALALFAKLYPELTKTRDRPLSDPVLQASRRELEHKNRVKGNHGGGYPVLRS